LEISARLWHKAELVLQPKAEEGFGFKEAEELDSAFG
jgi:hypothetical protein